jgi:hypothetical protein
MAITLDELVGGTGSARKDLGGKNKYSLEDLINMVRLSLVETDFQA